MIRGIERIADMKTALFGVIKSRYNLSGRDWVNLLSREDREAFLYVTLRAGGDYGRKGGKARGLRGKRDAKGRFVK